MQGMFTFFPPHTLMQIQANVISDRVFILKSILKIVKISINVREISNIYLKMHYIFTTDAYLLSYESVINRGIFLF